MKNRKQIISWCLFDFANSSYSAVIAAVVFPVYYVSVIVGNSAGQGDLWWGRAISASMAFVALTSPFLGGIADYSGRRKRFLLFYTLLCVLSVTGFSFLGRGTVVAGFMLVAAANIGMEGGLVFYNSFLPEIADEEHHGRVSGWGYAVGYAGSILSLLMAIPLVRGGYYHGTWLMVSLFFLVFSMPAFLFLPPDCKSGASVIDGATKGGIYAWKTLRIILKGREVRKFLLAFLIYQDGVNTVIVFSSIFAATTLGFTVGQLIVLYVLVQFSALAGSLIMAKPIDVAGPKKVVMLSLVLWSLVAVTAFFIHQKLHFMVLAGVAGLGLGTVQASSRAFFTQFVPAGHESEYFGIYSLVGKSSAIFGPLLFGYLSETFRSQRPAILFIASFFIVGLPLVRAVSGGGPNIKKGTLVNSRKT
jgi:MFS transporter, UMF1 family